MRQQKTLLIIIMNFTTTLLNNKHHSVSFYIWLISLISAIFITSCRKSDSGNIKLPVQDQVLSTYYRDTFSIETSTRLRPNFINSTNPVAGLVGNYNDPIFGNVNAKTFFNLTINEEFRNFGTNASCDSVVLEIPFQFFSENGNIKPNYVGDTLSDLVLELYKVLEEINPDVVYGISDSLQLEQTAIDETSIYLLPRTKNFKLYLPKDFGQQMIDQGSVDQEEFRNRFPGLCLKAKTGTGDAIYGFDLKSTSAQLKVYYRNSSSTGGLLFSMKLNNAYFNSISSDRTGTALESLSKDNSIPSTANGVSYLQGGTGVGTWIDIKDLAEFQKQEEGVIINKAILRIPLDFTTYGGEEEDPNYFVRLMKTDANGDFIFTDTDDDVDVTAYAAESVVNFESELLSRPSNAFSFDEEKKEYPLDITSYIQDIVLGKEEANPIFMVPFYSSASVNRSVILNPESKRPIKFEVYFTRIQ